MGDYWKRLHKLLPPSDEEKHLSLQLFNEFREKGYLNRLNRELAEFPLPVTVDFINRCIQLHGAVSPVNRKRDSRWMCETDFCFFNIRAGGTGRKTGDLVRSVLLLTGVRARGVHLAPVTRIAGENLNALTSHSHINPDLACPELEQFDLTPEEQLAGFVEAAHAMNFRVGFDLPLTLSWDAEVLYHKPGMFRWIKLDASRGYARESDLPFLQEISGEIQADYAKRITDIVNKQLARNVPWSRMGGFVRDEGFYPVPINTQRGLGVPYYITFDEEECCPQFSQSSQTTGMTTFMFTFPGREGEIIHNEAESYFSRIFPLWQEKYAIDFLYTDSREPAEKSSDHHRETPTGEQMRRLIGTNRRRKRFSGHMTSGEADQADLFAGNGFDLILDRTAPVRQDRAYMEEQLALGEEMLSWNGKGRQTFSIAFSQGYTERGSLTSLQRVRRNHFLARFLFCGARRRSKYEFMGTNDGSSGFINALGQAQNLEWSEDRSSADFYHTLEDIYRKEAAVLGKGEILHYSLDDRCFWWIIKGGRGLLVPVISVENEDMLPPGHLEIDITPYLPSRKSPAVLEYDFSSPSGNLVLFMGGTLSVDRIPYRNFRLYSIS